MSGIFISHTHGDQPISDALAALIDDLFSNQVQVSYSSKKELEGGIAPGEDWFGWIVDQVRQADVAFILLTPSSIQKPWVIWEAGAVAGAAFATSAEPAQARVFPLTFGIKASDVPTPFARTQLITGTDEADMMKLVADLVGRFSKGFTTQQIVRIGAGQGLAIKTYLERVNTILLKLPLVITEAAIQEWLSRLNELEDEHRFSEVVVMENWMDVAFGREAEDKQRPLDLRLHRRLGELYAAGGQASDAVRQFELARQLAPRDIFILRRLGQGYLDQKNVASAGTILAAIEALDKTAFDRNSENAALKARWYEQSNNLLGARDVLATAYQNIPSSYYLGDRLGQILITLGETAKAKEVYMQVRRVLRELREQNVWTHATALTAAIVCDDAAGVEQSLSNLRALKPSRGELDSIERGVRTLLTALRRDTKIVDQLREMEKQA
jgi:tetratricopeptide (TPR) repeat protein